MSPVVNPLYSRSRHVACKACIERWYATSAASGARPLSPNTRAPMDPTYYGPLYVTDVDTVDTDDTDATDDVVPLPVSVQRPFAGHGHIVALLDCSGSMASASKDGTEASPSRISMMIHMVKMLAQRFSNKGYYMSIMKFSSTCLSVVEKSERVPDHLIEALRPSGGTDMVTALTTAVSLHGTDPIYIMFTDGEPNPGTEAMTARVAKNFGDEFKLHVVGFGPQLNDGVMRSLSTSGRGTYTYIFDINTSSVMMSSLVAYLLAPPVVLSLSDETAHKTFVATLEQICLQPSLGVHGLLADLRKLPQTGYCKALQDDVMHPDVELGQISKALTNYNGWGKYYLSAILRAHQLTYTMSDLEKSLQYYASDEFNRVQRESMDSLKHLVFRPVTEADVVNVAAVTHTIVTSTGSAEDRGGCFSGDTKIRMLRGEPICIKDLRKGDKVASADKDGKEMVGTIDCIVAYSLDCPMPLYDEFITAYHPVYMGRKWHFPCDIYMQFGVATDYVYNIMLQQGACAVYVGDTPCIVLGHNITEDPVARHPYFGSNKVRDEITAQPGYDMGIVETDFSRTERGADTLIRSMF